MGQRLNTAATSEQDSSQSLLKAIMPVVKGSLEDREGFPPLAAVIAQDGSVRRVDDPMANRQATSTQQAVASLRAALLREAASGSVKATALAADVRIWRRDDGDEASNAVSVHVEHQSGYCVDLLIPYKVRRGMMSRLRKKPQVMFRTTIAQESDQVIFNQSAAAGKRGLTGQGEW